MEKEVLKDVTMMDVSGGAVRAKTTSFDEDLRWEQYKYEKGLEFERKKIDLEMKKAWIEGGFQLADSVLKTSVKVAGAVIAGV